MAERFTDFKNKRTVITDPKGINRPIYLFKNQRMCITQKPKWEHINEKYLQIGSEAWHYAFRNLSKSAFGLWLFSMENMNEYGWCLVPNYVRKHLNFKSETTYHNAKKELIEKGFWVDKSEEGDDYKETICLAFPEMDIEWCNSTWSKDYEHDKDKEDYPWLGFFDDDYDVSYEQEAWERRW